jgi:hypothetical protein
VNSKAHSHTCTSAQEPINTSFIIRKEAKTKQQVLQTAKQQKCKKAQHNNSRKRDACARNICSEQATITQTWAEKAEHRSL